MTFNPNDPTASGMVLTFDDEFNTLSVSDDNVADGTLWNNHLWYEGANPGGVTVANGIASIVDTNLSTVNSSGQGFAQTYGYFEADLKLPAGVGTWPAFWLMSQQHAVNGANPASEIDIMEGQGSYPDGYFTTLHYDTGTAQDTYNPVPNWTPDLGDGALSNGFHRYGLLWSPNSNVITFYFDGKAVATATEYSTTNYSPDMVILSTAEGAMLASNEPTAATGHPALEADYVRIYQFTSQDPTAVVAQLDSPPAGDTDPTVLANADGAPLSGSSAASDPLAVAPTLTVTPAGGGENAAIGLDITASQAASGLAASDLTVTVTGLDGATLNHGTANADGSYTLEASALTGLTVTPASGFSGTLALGVTATDTEPSSSTSATSVAATLDVTVAPTGSVLSTTGGAVSSGATASFNPANPEASGMVLTFDDEFNVASISADGAADGTLWNNHLWYQPANPGGVTVANGVANFTAGADLSTLDAAGQGFSQKYGYFDASIAFSGGAGGVPVFWTMSAQHPVTGSAATDIDVMKALTGSSDYQAAVQSDAGAADNQVASNSIDLTQGFHTYGVLWAPNSPDLIWYLDGKEVAETAAPSDLGSAAMMLNLSLGTTATGASGGSAPSMQVDWVHAYQLADQGSTAVTPQAGFTGDADTAAVAMAPTLTVTPASGSEGSAIPLGIAAAQATSDLATSDLTVTVSGLDGATLNHGTENDDGSYTLQATDLSGLTLTPASNFTGTLALAVTSTDTEAASDTSASSPTDTLDVTVAAAAGAGSSTPSFDPTNPAASGMVLTFDDEFNSASISADGAADGTPWNNHLWYQPANPGGVTVADGVASFTAGADLSTLDAAGQGFSQKYGYFEASIAFSGGAGGVPVFWLMSAQHPVSGTAATDIDVMKALTGDPGQYTASVQSNAGAADNQVASNSVDLTQGFHTYGVLWAPNSPDLIWYLDGQEVAETAAPSDSDSAAMMLNLSLGTAANASAGGSAPGMQVDWVHVYQFADQSPTAVTPQAGFTEPTESAGTSTPMMLTPTFSHGGHEVYVFNAVPTAPEEIANFNPASDVLDIKPLLKAAGYTGTDPIGDQIITLAPTANGSTEMLFDPTGQQPNHGTALVTLDHVLPQNVPATDIWH